MYTFNTRAHVCIHLIHTCTCMYTFNHAHTRCSTDPTRHPGTTGQRCAGQGQLKRARCFSVACSWLAVTGISIGHGPIAPNPRPVTRAVASSLWTQVNIEGSVPRVSPRTHATCCNGQLQTPAVAASLRVHQDELRERTNSLCLSSSNGSRGPWCGDATREVEEGRRV